MRWRWKPASVRARDGLAIQTQEVTRTCVPSCRGGSVATILRTQQERNTSCVVSACEHVTIRRTARQILGAATLLLCHLQRSTTDDVQGYAQLTAKLARHAQRAQGTTLQRIRTVAESTARNAAQNGSAKKQPCFTAGLYRANILFAVGESILADLAPDELAHPRTLESYVYSEQGQQLDRPSRYAFGSDAQAIFLHRSEGLSGGATGPNHQHYPAPPDSCAPPDS